MHFSKEKNGYERGEQMRYLKIIFLFMIVIIVAQSIIIVKQNVNAKVLKKGLSDYEKRLSVAEAENGNLKSLIKIKERKNIKVDSAMETLIKEDLMKNSAIINISGIKGGSFAFYDKSGISVLNERWVIAKFDDGHINGEMVLEYKIMQDRSIKWKKIVSYIE